MVHKKKRKEPPAERETSTEIKEEEGEERREENYAPSAKRARIIVRNLPFANLSENMVRDLFAKYGNILDVNLLKKQNGQFVGCGFVEFDSRMAAAKAIAHVNGKQLNGRPVILDWALPKHTYVGKMQPAEPEIKEEPQSDDDDKDGILDYSADTKPDVEEDLEDDQDDDDEEEEDDDDFEEEEEDDGEVEIEEAPKRKRSNDVDEGRTVFLKNVPFSASNEDVKASVARYGDVVYALVCVDKLTEHSKGTAFVKFKKMLQEKDSADNCIRDSNTLTIKDQPVEVSKAVSRDKLDEEKKQKKLKTKDSRNLYLVREGVVMAGSPAAVTVSPADMAKRLQIEQWKTQILRNLNMFVSRTRIVVHNLPPDYDDAKFRRMIESYVKPGVVVKEARVMHDRKHFDGKGNPLSKELGFATFINHEDALHVLRSINNNPDVFTPAKRPIVSFSVENREILNMKQKRMEKSKVKSLGDKAKDKLAKLSRQQRRFIRRKEKMIQLKEEKKQAKKEGRTIEPKKNKEVIEPKKNKNENGEVQSISRKFQKGQKKNEDSKVGKKQQNGKSAKLQKPGSGTGARDEENEPDYSGAISVPGKKMKMRSKLKLRKQVEIHKNRLKEVKKVKKMQKQEQEKKQIRKDRDPVKIKSKKKPYRDDKFAKLITTYKDQIEKSATSASNKWYDS